MKTTRRKLRSVIREVLSTAELDKEVHAESHDQDLGEQIPPEELHDALSSAIWDLYKSVHGIRPRWVDFKSMSVPELEKMWHDLDDEIKQKEDEERYSATDADWGDIDPDISQAEKYRDDHEAWKAERERMMSPEEGEDQPKRMGMGRRPLVGPARDVRRGRTISEAKMKITPRQLRQIIKEEISLIESQWDTDGDNTVDWSELEARERAGSLPLVRDTPAQGYHLDPTFQVYIRDDITRQRLQGDYMLQQQLDAAMTPYI